MKMTNSKNVSKEIVAKAYHIFKDYRVRLCDNVKYLRKNFGEKIFQVIKVGVHTYSIRTHNMVYFVTFVCFCSVNFYAINYDKRTRFSYYIRKIIVLP